MVETIVKSGSVESWDNLIKDASKFCNINLAEDLKTYLVFLLMRYSTEYALADKIVATSFLETAHKTGTDKIVV